MVKETVKDLRSEMPIPKRALFVRDFLRTHREGYPSGIHTLYKRTYRNSKTTRGGKYRLGTYNSFMTFVSKLILTGLIERTGETQESTNPKAEALNYPERVFIRLTDKGERAGDYVWNAPLRLWYHPFDWERDTYGEFIKE